MARGDVARLCRVGEGKTSSGRNSGSSANRSSKYTSERTLPVQQTHTQNTEYIHTIQRFALHQIFTEALTHLSTESKVFFSGGGRALILLGVGQSLSDCGGGRAGSVPDGGGRGEDGRDSLHPPCRKRSVHVVYMRARLICVCTTAGLWCCRDRVMLRSPLWTLCCPCSWCQRSLQYWSPPAVCQRTAAPRLDVLMETLSALKVQDQKRSGCLLQIPFPCPFHVLSPVPCPFPCLCLAPFPCLGLLHHSCLQGWLPPLPSPSAGSWLEAVITYVHCLKIKGKM